MISKLKRIIKEPLKYFSPRRIVYYTIGDRLFLLWLKLSRCISSDKLYLRVFYLLGMKEVLRFNSPINYTQKIQCLKLINKDPLYSSLVDKYRVRRIVESKIGRQYLIPIYGVWDKFSDIDFDLLPDSFVLKTTHDSGTIMICKNKSSMNMKSLNKKFSASLKRNYFYKTREYPYKNAIPRIIAEKLLIENSFDRLTDYKFFCFSGKPELLQVTSWKNNMRFVTYLTIDFQLSEIKDPSEPVDTHLVAPQNYEKMVEIASTLSKDIIHVRIDLYNVEGQIYFGEYTFHHCGGIIKWEPKAWNKKIGEFIQL